MDKTERYDKWVQENPELAAKITASTKRKEEAAKKNLSRAKEMLGFYREAYTLEDIGIHYGITRERVRQILVKFFAVEVKALTQKNFKVRSERLRQERYERVQTCKNCEKEFHNITDRKYCSLECWRNKVKLNDYPEWVNGRSIRKRNFTKEEWRIINNIKTKSYYHRNIEQQRRKSAAYQKKNKKRHALYQKRAAERKKYGYAVTPLENPKNIGATKP